MNDVFAQPVGCVREGRGEGWQRPPIAPVLAYTVAAMAGGMLVGGALALCGAALAAWLPTLVLRAAAVGVALLGVAAVLLEAAGRVAPLPERREQVPRAWLMWTSKSRTAAAFGFMLGAGVFTYLIHATAYVVAAVLLLSGSPVAGLVAGAAYGLTRGAMLAYAWAVAPSRRGSNRVPDLVATASRLLPAAGALSIAVTAVALVAA